jgi:hypothetical protein
LFRSFHTLDSGGTELDEDDTIIIILVAKARLIYMMSFDPRASLFRLLDEDKG